MFFRRDKKKGAAKAKGRTEAAGPAHVGKGAARTKASADGAATSGKTGGNRAGAPPQSREEAERLILQRLADGSAEQQRQLAQLRNAGELFDRHPDEAARLVRDWLTKRKG